MLAGLLEILSNQFVTGWTRSNPETGKPVFAAVGDQIVGWTEADIIRPDLNRQAPGAAAQDGNGERGYGFTLIFTRPLSDEELRGLRVYTANPSREIPRAERIRVDNPTVRQIFILGSPRSGTSEMASTLATILSLPWLGEGHAAPMFHSAAKALSGDTSDLGGIVAFLRRQEFSRTIIEITRKAYFTVHASASFLDKTPGIPMIRAAPFLAEAFPKASFIFMRRNGISNVLSRMAKFGGNFESHCSDWAGAITAWQDAKQRLPHFLEIQQEAMLANPEDVGRTVTDYLGVPEVGEMVGGNLRNGSYEKTGAGIGRSTLAQTGWTEAQSRTFQRLCGNAMALSGYEM